VNPPVKPTNANSALIPAGFVAAPESKVDVQGRPLVLTGTKQAEPLNLRMILIPGGTFDIGEPPLDDKTKPQTHKETVGDFAMSETEVTNGQMKTYYKAKGITSFPVEFQYAIDKLKQAKVPDAEIDDHPAVGISHTEAESFARWAGGELPTEAQWEYAARSRGLADRYYVWPDTIPPKRKLKTQQGDVNLDNLEGRDTKTATVREYPKDKTNEGICQMMGNVREWCRDKEDLPGVEAFVVRGGAFDSQADLYSNFAREVLAGKEQLPNLGFRIVVEMPTGAAAVGAVKQ
jgi:serine/threonine-protein kinase